MTACVAVLALLGWTLDVRWLRGGFSSAPIHANGAAAMLLLSCAALSTFRSGRLPRAAAVAASAAAAMLALAAFSAARGGPGGALDALFVPGKAVPVEYARMSTLASVYVVGLAGALLMRALLPAFRRAHVVLALVPVAVATTASLASAFGAVPLTRIGGGRPPGPLGTLPLLLLAIGVLIDVLPSERLAWWRADTAGARLVRRLVPLSVVWLVVVGLLLNMRLVGYGGVSHAADVAIVVLVNAVVISALLVDAGTRLDRQLAATDEARGALDAARGLTNRAALEFNDDVVQLLATAWLAEDLGARSTVRDAVREASQRAQVIASTLLRATVGSGPLAPGTLVRTAAPGGHATGGAAPAGSETHPAHHADASVPQGRLVVVAVGLGLALGVSSLVGWATGIERLRGGSVLGPITANGAAGAALLAVAVWAGRGSRRAARLVTLGSSAGAAMLAAAALSADRGGPGQALDALLVPGDVLPEFARMSTLASAAYLGFAGALWVRILFPARRRAFLALLGLPLMVSVVGLMGHAFSAPELTRPLGGPAPAPLVLLLFGLFAVGLAVDTLSPVRWARFLGDAPSVRFVRRLVPVSVVWLMTVGLLLNVRLADLGPGHERDVAVVAILSAAVISALLVEAGVRLDRQLSQTEAARAALDAELRFANRKALELNDDVVQLLARAWLADDLGDASGGRDAIREALHSAQAIASTLLYGTAVGVPIVPGALVRNGSSDHAAARSGALTTQLPDGIRR